MPSTSFSVCPHDCPSACALEIERGVDGRVQRVRGDEGHPYTAGILCGKVARYADRLYHPDRLTCPLLRTGPKGSDAFAPIEWGEALDRIAEKFRDAADEYGAESVWPYYYAGTMGLVQRDGINRLRHAMGYSGQELTICTSLAYNGFIAGTGALHGPRAEEMTQSDLIIIWGCNAAATQIQVMALARRARTERETRIVVIDPYRNATARAADEHLMPRPGTDGALACGIMHHLFNAGHADREYMRRCADVPEALEAHLATRTPAWAARITGIPESRIIALADLYGRTPRSYIRMGLGMSRCRNGALNVHAVTCLPTVTGAWQHTGGGALMSTGGLFSNLDMSLIDGSDVRNPGARTLDMSRIGPTLCGNREDLAGGPPVRAMLVQNTNPAVVAPESARVREGLAREDLFLCVHEQFMTETALYADIVLPATMFTEHDDLYRSFGHSYLQLGLKVVEPPGECRSNHRLIVDLAERLGAQHPGFRMSARELIDATLRANELGNLDTLVEQRWIDMAAADGDMGFERGFAWPDGRFRFKPDWDALGRHGHRMPRMPDHWDVIDGTDSAHPYRLFAPPAHNFLNTTFTEIPRSRSKESRPHLKIHPDDAANAGLVEGELVEVGNRLGSIKIHVQAFAGISRGVLAVEGIWPNAAFPDGCGVNTLISAEPGAPAGGAVFHDTAVWLRQLA